MISKHRLRAVSIAIVLMVSVCTGRSAAEYQEGIRALHGGDYAKALSLLRPLAEQGDARAQNALAYIHQRGLGVPKDAGLAEHWRQRATTSLVGKTKPPRIPNKPPLPETFPTRATSTGSGFLVDRRGSVVTNHHVIRKCKRLHVGSVKAVTMARVVRTDPASDLALLRLDVPLNREPAAFRLQKAAVPGESVLIAGYPLQGLLAPEVQVASGIVSALAGPRGNPHLLQISAQVQPGSSGGPVLDTGGRIIGVVAGRLGSKDGSHANTPWIPGVSFAVRAENLLHFLTSAGVRYRTAGPDTLDTRALAANARQFTLLIECFK